MPRGIQRLQQRDPETDHVVMPARQPRRILQNRNEAARNRGEEQHDRQEARKRNISIPQPNSRRQRPNDQPRERERRKTRRQAGDSRQGQV